ncbi:MAG: YqcC family protein [Succinatimonas hippei]|nr:YqcC family protein [Succinatimonas hippei]
MKMNTKIEQIELALKEIELVMRKLNIWSDGKNRPDDRAFLSQSPFFLDTMNFEQWLEFVFVPRFYSLIESGSKLPENVVIHTYAQEFYRGRWQEYKELIQILMKFDKLFAKA